MTDAVIQTYWSMRSPFCYLALDRLLALEAEWRVRADIRIVYPFAIRNPEFFRTAPRHYRPYHLLDSQRVADYLGIPYRRPVPDPIVQDMETNKIADEQPYIHRLTRLATGAQVQGRALAFLDEVMRLIRDGRTDNWHEGTHLADALSRAGLDAAALMDEVDTQPRKFDEIIDRNQAAQATAGHAGVPLFVLDGEPFFGQDRLDHLRWRLEQTGMERG